MPTNVLTNAWLGINPGLLRHRIDIEVSVETSDSHGQPIPSWSALYANVKAFVEPLSGDELFNARQVHAEVTHRITIRYLAGIVPKNRILFGARVFDILYVPNLEERGLLIQIMAKERIDIPTL